MDEDQKKVNQLLQELGDFNYDKEKLSSSKAEIFYSALWERKKLDNEWEAKELIAARLALLWILLRNVSDLVDYTFYRSFVLGSSVFSSLLSK